MADTMTLEQVRDWLRAEAKTTNLVAVEARFNLFADAIDAAILDRDADRFTASNQTLRAERAEAELASLKAKIEAASLATFRCTMLGTPHAWIDEKFACPEWIGKHVRLVVEE